MQKFVMVMRYLGLWRTYGDNTSLRDNHFENAKRGLVAAKMKQTEAYVQRPA